MKVETLNTAGGRIAVHLICLGRSLWQGRFGSVGFFCAGILRGLRELMRKGSWQSSGTQASRVGGVRL